MWMLFKLKIRRLGMRRLFSWSFVRHNHLWLFRANRFIRNYRLRLFDLWRFFSFWRFFNLFRFITLQRLILNFRKSKSVVAIIHIFRCWIGWLLFLSSHVLVVNWLRNRVIMQNYAKISRIQMANRRPAVQLQSASIDLPFDKTASSSRFLFSIKSSRLFLPKTEILLQGNSKIPGTSMKQYYSTERMRKSCLKTDTLS